MTSDPLDNIVGPRIFTPHRLHETDARDGGARAWIDRALMGYYFYKHDNEPSTFQEINEWIEGLTPQAVIDGLLLMASVGYP